MDLRDFFYITASITLIFVSIAVISIFYLLFRLKQLLDESIVKISKLTSIYSKAAAARFLIRILRLIF